MATPTSHRVGIWVIAVVLTVGTIMGFVAMILSSKNQATDATAQQQATAQYQAQMKQAQAERQKTLRPLDGYSAAPFDASSVTALKVDVLQQGDGNVVNATDTLKANYFGWTADGKIFDSTNINGTTTPTDQLSLSNVIPGWQQGLVGQKIGSTVKLTIPADLAYGNTDNGTGQPTGPLVFIVQILGVK